MREGGEPVDGIYILLHSCGLGLLGPFTLAQLTIDRFSVVVQSGVLSTFGCKSMRHTWPPLSDGRMGESVFVSCPMVLVVFDSFRSPMTGGQFWTPRMGNVYMDMSWPRAAFPPK